MSVQKKTPVTIQVKTTAPSMIESLEGRQLFSAVGGPTIDVDTTAPVDAGKVTQSDISIVIRVNKSSPQLATAPPQIDLENILISSTSVASAG